MNFDDEKSNKTLLKYKLTKIQTQQELLKKLKDLSKFSELEKDENEEDQKHISRAMRFHSRPRQSHQRIKTEYKN